MRDFLVEEMAPQLAADDYDLLLAYFKGVDNISHANWQRAPRAGLPPVSRQPLTHRIIGHGGTTFLACEAMQESVRATPRRPT